MPAAVIPAISIRRAIRFRKAARSMLHDPAAEGCRFFRGDGLETRPRDGR